MQYSCALSFTNESIRFKDCVSVYYYVVQGSVVMGTGIYFYVYRVMCLQGHVIMCAGLGDRCHLYSDLFLCGYRGLLS